MRREPVRRDEIRVYRRVDGDGKPQWLVTMPPGTYRLEEQSQYFVGDAALWQPLTDELAAQYAPLKLEIFISNAFEYRCEQCGTRFLANRLAGKMLHLCSDRCERERHNARCAVGGAQQPRQIISAGIAVPAPRSAPRPPLTAPASIAASRSR